MTPKRAAAPEQASPPRSGRNQSPKTTTPPRRPPRPVRTVRDESPEDLARPCPKCQAQPNHRCTTPTGRNTPIHRERRTTPPPIGRTPTLTANPELTDRITRLLRLGTPLNAAAATEGLSPQTLYRWLAQGQSDHPDDEPYRLFREAAMRARAEGLSWHVANVRGVAQGGQLKKKVIRTLRDGTKEEETEYAMPDWRASAFILERQFPREFGKRQTVELTGSDSVEPTAPDVVGGAGQDLGGLLGQAGVDRLATNLAAFAAQRQLTAERATVEEAAAGDVSDAEVIEDEERA